MSRQTLTPLIRSNISPKTGLTRNKPCCLLMGQTGAGKTTLGNMLCGTQHVSGAATASLTRVLFRNDVCVGKNAFSVIDTPGTDSQKDTFEHAWQLRAGLTATELNTVFIVLKYDNRYNNMIDHYLQVEQPVGTYTERIVVLVSHMDNADDQNKEFPLICGLLMETSPKIANIIFFSKKSDPDTIANLMYACMTQMAPTRLEISEDDFYKNFNLYQVRIGMRRSFDQYKKQVESILLAYALVVGDAKNEPQEDRDELFHALIVQFKYDLDDLYEEFVNKHRKDMIEMDQYALSVEFQKEIIKNCDEFVSTVTPLMSYNLFDNSDPRNQIKACPHCGQIWWKTEGCDGATACGNRVSEFFDLRKRAVFKYVLTWVDGKLTYTKNPVTQRTNPVNTAKPSGKGVGCGRAIVWSELPKISDKIVFQIFEVKSWDEVKSIIRSEGYQRAEACYRRNIDTSFHT
ncbi:uncharacterized protein LOC129589541 [Paramacrobiotus metropolitanus]|uniref:uncharacterized protein LOC129589541 n=1 Tax=Paramacrobiotus metropolitanus TaxID=2943436 RepID=UPI0024464674|nr:uncharacterized protein LOC129589541 [Paramacrobiotus metropolitanus]